MLHAASLVEIILGFLREGDVQVNDYLHATYTDKDCCKWPVRKAKGNECHPRTSMLSQFCLSGSVHRAKKIDPLWAHSCPYGAPIKFAQSVRLYARTATQIYVECDNGEVQEKLNEFFFFFSLTSYSAWILTLVSALIMSVACKIFSEAKIFRQNIVERTETQPFNF